MLKHCPSCARGTSNEVAEGDPNKFYLLRHYVTPPLSKEEDFK